MKLQKKFNESEIASSDDARIPAPATVTSKIDQEIIDIMSAGPCKKLSREEMAELLQQGG